MRFVYNHDNPCFHSGAFLCPPPPGDKVARLQDDAPLMGLAGLSRRRCVARTLHVRAGMGSSQKVRSCPNLLRFDLVLVVSPIPLAVIPAKARIHPPAIHWIPNRVGNDRLKEPPPG